MMMAAWDGRILGMRFAQGFPVLVAAVCALFVAWSLTETLIVMLRVRAATSRRPGWTWRRDATSLRASHRGLLAGHVGRARWRWLISGQLPGGAQAQVFRVHSERLTGKYASEHRDTTTAVVVFPFALPRISLGYDPDQAHPEQLAWDRLTGDPGADPEAAAALYTLDVLDAARAGKYRWQLEGNTVVLTARARLSPARMVELVDYVPTLAQRLPAAVLERAARTERLVGERPA
jgi:hypothetical protein